MKKIEIIRETTTCTNRIMTICNDCDCDRRAFYAQDYVDKLKYCSRHKTPSMINVVSRHCDYIDATTGKTCTKIPSYAIVNTTLAIRCAVHTTNDMFDTKHKRCCIELCTLSASYGTGKSVTHCAIHRTEDMKELKHPRCDHVDSNGKKCTRSTSYGAPGTSATKCAEHAEQDMTDVKHQRCVYKDESGKQCERIPTYNTPGLPARYCLEHKTNVMVDSSRKRCAHTYTDGSQCVSRATCNIPGNEPILCVEHRTNGMSLVVVRLCEHIDSKGIRCSTQAMFDIKGAKIPRFCGVHKEKNMINIRATYCKSCGLYQVVKENNNLCSYCNPVRNSKRKTKENRVRDIILGVLQDDKFKHLKMTQDKAILVKTCKRYRPDFYIETAWYTVVVECDELGHSGYTLECEYTRMRAIAQMSGMKTVFIRYNPDKHGISKSRREQELKHALYDTLSAEPVFDNERLCVMYLYVHDTV